MYSYVLLMKMNLQVVFCKIMTGSSKNPVNHVAALRYYTQNTQTGLSTEPEPCHEYGQADAGNADYLLSF